MPDEAERLLYCDHVEGKGEGLFRLACEHDLEGIVAKHKYALCSGQLKLNPMVLLINCDR